MPRPSPRIAAFAFLAALLLATALLLARLGGDPDTAILRSRGEAEWIRLPGEPSPRHQPTRMQIVRFRTRLELAAPPAEASLEVLALRRFELRVNGARVGGSVEGDAPWIEPGVFDVSSLLRSGENIVRVDVGNAKGPPAVRVRAPSLGLASGAGWEARESKAPGAHGDWQAVARARERVGFPLSDEFPTSAASLASSALPLVACFALGFAVCWLVTARESREGSTLPAPWLDAGALRWLLLAAWAALCARNLLRIPLHVGMDVASHYQYVRFIAEQAALPLAGDGPQTFQPPLFYLLAAPLDALLSRILEPETARMALRCVPMLAGLGLVEIGYRSALAVFPDRRDLRLIATLVAGLLPVSLYMAHSVANEPLAAWLTALVMLGTFRMLVAPSATGFARRCALLGALFGAAVLTKVTALLLAPALLLALLWAHPMGPPSSPVAGSRTPLAGLAAFGLAAVAVCGWYFARNWIELGVPYVGGWDPALVGDTGRDLGWQSPGYRVPGDAWGFGRSLVQPVYASIFGFWDGFYSSLFLDGFLSGIVVVDAAPPWNYPLMISLALLSLPLAAAILCGALRSLVSRAGGRDDAARFAVLCLATLVAAMLFLHFSVPTFSNVKASYTLGLTPCYALLASSGFAAVLRGRWSRALVAGYLTAWGAFSWAAFWG
ncbi:MAG: hypothetical protein QNK04_31865 [Myxococcota bacterium]|nr:hypothetical protein [Myxococcota bacterium]